MKYKIINLINNISSTSIPVEVANKLNDEEFNSIIISLYDNNKEAKIKAEKNNITCKVIGIGLNNKFNIKKYFELYKLIRKINPDAVHTHHTITGFLGTIIGKITNKTYIISTVHNDIRYFNWYQKYTRYIIYPFNDFIIYNSENTQYSLPNLVTKNLHSKVVYNGVDIKKIINQNDDQILKKYDISNDDFCISNVGMLVRQKDHKTLIKAFKLFKDKIKSKNIKLIIVGEGKLRNRIENLIKQLNLEENVILTGLILRNHVYQIINNSDMFIMSSIYEGFCNAMVEAMVAENSIIASNIDPLPEVLGENNGLFFEQGNAEILAKKMIYLYKNKQIRKKLAKRAKEYAINNYSLEKCVEEYKNVYNNLLISR